MTTPPGTADPAALLAESQRIADALAFACRLPDKKPDFFACGGPAAEAYWEHFTPARVSSLLAAIGAVLELAGDWELRAGRLYGLDDASSRTFDQCAEKLREAITRALTGQEGDRG